MVLLCEKWTFLPDDLSGKEECQFRTPHAAWKNGETFPQNRKNPATNVVGLFRTGGVTFSVCKDITLSVDRYQHTHGYPNCRVEIRDIPWGEGRRKLQGCRRHVLTSILSDPRRDSIFFRFFRQGRYEDDCLFSKRSKRPFRSR